MATSNVLFELIHSMTKTEKSYFRKQSSVFSKRTDNRFLKLYDALQSQTVYDQEVVKQKVGKQKPGHFPVTKQYLLNGLLSNLELYHRKTNSRMQVRNEISQAEVLYEKGFYQFCLKKINALTKRCREAGFIEEELLCLNLAYRVYAENNELYSELKLAEIISQRTVLINALQLINRLATLHRQVAQLVIKEGVVRSEKGRQQLNKLLKNKLLAEPPVHSFSLEGEVYRLGIISLIHHLLGNGGKAYRYKKLELELFEQNKHFHKSRQRSYLQKLGNLLAFGFTFQHLDDFETILKKVNVIETRNKQILATRFEVYYLYRLLWLKHLEKWNEIKKLVNDFEKKEPEYRNEMHVVALHGLWVNITIALFHARDFNNALKWLNKVALAAIDERVEHLYRFSLIFSLLIYFETGATDLIDMKFRQVYRHLLKSENKYLVEKHMLNFVKQFIRSGQSKLSELLKELLQNMNNAFADPNEAAVLQYFDFCGWLESKIG